MSTPSLRNQILIAMPQLKDPMFADTVTYICEHTEDGAMGIVINRPTEMRLGELLEQAGIELHAKKNIGEGGICAGGPIELQRGFVLHNREPGLEQYWESTLRISEDIQLTTSKDILEALATGLGPSHFLIALGYAGWGAGQLEKELGENAWLSCACSPSLLFETPLHKRREEAAASMGVNLQLLSTDIGHA